MRKCDRLACMWHLYSHNFSDYDPYSRQQWERVQKERESCPKDCEKYIERQEVIDWWKNRKKELSLD